MHCCTAGIDITLSCAACIFNAGLQQPGHANLYWQTCTCHCIGTRPKVKGSSCLHATPQQIWAQGLEAVGVHRHGLSRLEQRQQSASPVDDVCVCRILHEDVKSIASCAAWFLCSKGASEENLLLPHLTLVPVHVCSSMFHSQRCLSGCFSNTWQWIYT